MRVSPLSYGASFPVGYGSHGSRGSRGYRSHGCGCHVPPPPPPCPPPPCAHKLEHRPFHEHLGSGANGSYGGTLELWRLWSRLNELAREAERVQLPGGERGHGQRGEDWDRTGRNELRNVERDDDGNRHRERAHGMRRALAAAYSAGHTTSERLIDAML